MVDHQEHFGRKFYQDKKTGYWISTDYPRIRAHRWVWISLHGIIPPGYHIHHRNENKSDNSIENLELIERSRHLSHHYTEEKRELSRKRAAEIRPLTKAWHASEEGRAWHRHHALKCKLGNWVPKDYKCEICHIEFKSKKLSNTKFCSNACKSKWRRDSGLDNVNRKCPTCSKEFSINKYKKTTFCSRKCAQNRFGSRFL